MFVLIAVLQVISGLGLFFHYEEGLGKSNQAQKLPAIQLLIQTSDL
jgi:hypothetical protein